MTQQKRFYRKLVCVVIVIALLLLLNWMGHPSYVKGTVGKNAQERTYAPGGKLAQLRDEYGLSETKLGEIDPAGSAMKLATFGMRGVAVALLWNRSLECEKRSDWESVRTIGEQITSLEPHFITIWDFVGWKLAYNASAQYDDYRERYRWVTNGFEFIQSGTVYNRFSAKLFKQTGWTISQKIGIADEKSQYRRLFREDHDFHQRQKDHFWEGFWSRYQREFSYDDRPDNWLFGRVFYLAAEELFEDPANNGSDLGKETRPVFYCRSRMNLINYARWMEIDGCGVTKNNTPIFDDLNAAGAWRTAEKAWREFSEKRITSVIEDPKKKGTYRVTSLNEFLDCQKEREAVLNELAAMLPDGMTIESVVWDRFQNELDDEQRGALYNSLLHPAPESDLTHGPNDRSIRIIRDYLDGKHGPVSGWEDWREKLAALKRESCPEELRPIYDIPELLRSQEESVRLAPFQTKLVMLSGKARNLLAVEGKILAERIEGENRLKADDLCDQLTAIRYRSAFSSMYREMLDCNKHERDVVVEQLPEARLARDLRAQTRDKFNAAQHEEASAAFLGSMAEWKKVLDMPRFEELNYMSQYQSAFLDEVEKYTIVLDQLERIFPEDYPFQACAAASEKEMIDEVRDALAWIQEREEEGDWGTVYDNSLKLLRFWQYYFSQSEIAPLFPTVESREFFTRTLRGFVRSCEELGGAKMEEARQLGLIDDYPLKPHLELLVNKGEPLYESIRKNELSVLTDAADESAALEKSVSLWKELLEKYPILNYDRTSEFRPQIEQTAKRYLERLKEEGKEAPEGFLPETFLN